MAKKSVLVVLGTRPEAIKLSPVIRSLRNSKILNPIVISTGQHSDLMESTLIDLKITPDYTLSVMKINQTLVESASKILSKLQAILESEKPCATIVQGDTTSALMGALASFYNKVPVCHVEAGLRTQDLFMPFPEEANRRLISVIASLHFTPTEISTRELLSEGHPKSSVQQTGNTGIDALLYMEKSINEGIVQFPKSITSIASLENLVLVTCHRRETFGDPLLEVCEAIAYLADTNKELNFVFPLHPNPNVIEVVKTKLSGRSNVHLVAAVPYSQLVLILSKARVIITDSGGIQEEAPSLGKRTIVLRTVTERTDAVINGMATMVGTNKEKIINAVIGEMQKEDHNVSTRSKLFGDGNASERIMRSIEDKFG